MFGALAAVALAVVKSRFTQTLLKHRVVALLREKFHADVQIGEFDAGLLPHVHIHGTNLVLRHEGRTDVPPLIQIAEFYASAHLGLLATRVWTIDAVKLRGLKITIAHGAKGAPRKGWSRLRDFPVLIRLLDVDDGEIEILPRDEGKPSHLFAIRDLKMHYVGMLRPGRFETELTNPTPPGVIQAEGKFGPWNPDDPGRTPLAASYVFSHADLGVFKGISGILSSHGEFGGVLNQIEVNGETDTPDFRVTVSGQPVHLRTTFSATVDGTNGNTILHPVRAQFLHSVIVAEGAVKKHDGERGRSVVLDLKAQSAHLEDLLRLAVKSKTPPFTGRVSMDTKFDLPPGENDLSERLNLDGIFKSPDLEFTSSAVDEKISAMSRKALGKPEDPAAGSDVSRLLGRFRLDNGVITFQKLNFGVEGADINVNGSYGLKNEELDFHGDLRMKAKLSQTVTGFKSLLLKPVDRFFRKGGMTQIPIKITGSRESPDIGLDLHHKSEASR